MNILVLLKQVPDMERVKFDSEKGVVDRKSAGAEINPFDLNALEAAVQINEQIGANITVISMGPPNAAEALKEGISRGAHDGILLSDRYFGGADTKATANTLASAIKKIGNFDLIIAGEKTVDGDTGQVGPEIAEFLRIPHVSYVSNVKEIDNKHMVVVSDIWGGSYLKDVILPCMITVTKDINVPRLPSFKSKMAAKKAEITIWGIEDLKDYLTVEDTGFKGSPTTVKKIEVPAAVKREGKVWRKDDLNAALDTIINSLKEKKVLEA